jgi:mycothiol synthase
MDGLTIRPYAGSDAASVAPMMSAVLAAGGLSRPFSEGVIRSWFSRAADLAADTRLMLATDGTVAAAALVTAPSSSGPGSGGTRAGAIGGVHPGYRGQGLGRDLLAWQFERAAAMRAAAPAGPPWLIQAQAGQADESAARLFRRFGLAPVRYFLGMQAATAGDRAAPAPPGIRVLPYSAPLRAAVHAAHEEAFADHWGHEYSDAEAWSAHTTGDPTFRPDLSRIGLDAGEVAGYVLAYAAPADSIYIGQVGTRRPWRGQGLASALLAASLAAAAAAGLTSAALDVDADSPTGAVAIYERLGFTAAAVPSVTYERAL